MASTFHHALRILEEVCIGCTHCMKACPTEALRVADGKAVLMPDRCVDCGKCMQVCPVHAIFIEPDDFDSILKYKARVALVPSVLIGQFPRHHAARKIYSGILEQGFTHVYEAEHGSSILIEQINRYVEENQDIRPVISSFCPAIVRLIQVRFPNLVENIVLLKAPLDLAAISFKQELLERGYAEDEIGIFYVTPCAAKIVITSYSIHYTKLYEIHSGHKRKSDRFGYQGKCHGESRKNIVFGVERKFGCANLHRYASLKKLQRYRITSYNVCYTKLLRWTYITCTVHFR